MVFDQDDRHDEFAHTLEEYPLFHALLGRRSRRFAAGLSLHGGPLAYDSALPPKPLTVQEEAALAFAACGLTGYALAELPYQPSGEPESGGGHIMAQFVGRTVPSADALADVIVLVNNDEGSWLLKRPQDFPRSESVDLLDMAHRRRFVELYERSRVRLSQVRREVPRKPPFVPSFNKWSANRPGTTYFVPIAECSAIYINVLLSAFEEDFSYFVVDERHRYEPVGIGKFGRSKGGYLRDNPRDGRYTTLSALETMIYELVAIEQGAMVQNLGLTAQALGLGGFPHYASHPFAWPQALGFRMEQPPLSRVVGAGPIVKTVLRLTNRDIPVPTPVGLEIDGQPVVTSYCPPYFGSMREAVLAFVDSKFAQGSGTFRDGGAATGWKDGASVQSGIPSYSDQAIEATIAYAEYVYQRYGRFPANSGPFRTVIAYQAHRLDRAFYDRFYRPDVV